MNRREDIPQPELGQCWVEPDTRRPRWVNRVPEGRFRWIFWCRSKSPGTMLPDGMCSPASWRRWAQRTGARPEPQP